jgi:hypothetical protein
MHPMAGADILTVCALLATAANSANSKRVNLKRSRKFFFIVVGFFSE